MKPVEASVGFWITRGGERVHVLGKMVVDRLEPWVGYDRNGIHHTWQGNGMYYLNKESIYDLIAKLPAACDSFHWDQETWLGKGYRLLEIGEVVRESDEHFFYKTWNKASRFQAGKAINPASNYWRRKLTEETPIAHDTSATVSHE